MARSPRRDVLSALAGLLMIAGLGLLDSIVLRAVFDVSYLRWYAENGFVVAAAFTFVTLAWQDVDRQTDLVSRHPLEYFRAQFFLWAFVFDSLAAVAGPSLPSPLRTVAILVQRQTEGRGTRRLQRAGEAILDWAELAIFFLLLAVVILAAALSILVVSPLQYMLVLVCGVPARMALESTRRAFVRARGDKVEAFEALAGGTAPKGAVESGFFSKPVALTNAFSALALWGVSFLVD